MRIKQVNLLLGFGLFLYIVAGVLALSNTSYSFIPLLASLIFLALGFYSNVKFRLTGMFKKRF